MKKILEKKLIVIILSVSAIILLFVGITVGWKGVKVSPVAVTRGDFRDIYTEKGIYKMGVEYRVVSNVSGPIQSVEVHENMEVKKGDLLVVVEDRDLNYQKELHQSTLLGYQAQLEQSNINQMMSISPQEYLDQVNKDLASSRAGYQAAKTLADGASALYQTGDVSKVEWEKAQAEYRDAESAYGTAKNRYEESQKFLEGLVRDGIDKESLNNRFYESVSGQLQSLIQSEKTAISQLEAQIEDCNVVAECDGTIISLPAQTMSVIQSGQVAAIINSNQEPVIEADVLTNMEPYLKVGSPVGVTQRLGNQEYQYNGTISELYDFAVKGTSALGLDEYRVRVKVKVDPGQDIQLKSGYAFDLQFTLFEGTDQLTVPINTVFQADQQDYVFVVENGYVTKKPVLIGYRSSSHAVILEGVEEADKIVANVDSEEIYEGLKAYY